MVLWFTVSLLPDHPDGYARPQRRQRPPLQQCSHVPGAPVCPGALPQRRPVQPPAGHLWVRLPQWVLWRTLSEQWVTRLSQFRHFYTKISFLKENCSRFGSTKCSGLSLTGLTLKRYMAVFIWLHFKLSMSGTEIGNILCNTTCSWLASVAELQLLHSPWRHGKNAKNQTRHVSFMSFLCRFQTGATGMKIMFAEYWWNSLNGYTFLTSCACHFVTRIDSLSEHSLSAFAINLVCAGSAPFLVN